MLCDTGVVITIVGRQQPQHQTYRQIVSRYARPLLTTVACLTEAMYLAHRLGGWAMQNPLGKLLIQGGLISYPLNSTQQFTRLFELMEQYRDRRSQCRRPYI